MGHDRIFNMVRDRGDWVISRQRIWGVPIPIYYCESCGEHIINDDTIKALQEKVAVEGSDAWWAHSAKELLPEGFKCLIAVMMSSKKKQTSWTSGSTQVHHGMGL